MSDLKDRTKRFAIDVIRLCSTLPNRPNCWTIGRQLLRSATSVGANYRAACRARSRREFLAKMSIVEEEVDESAFWLEMLTDLQIGSSDSVAQLLDEANQLTAITVSTIKTTRANGT
jgi:four helix bundle protein